MVMNAKRRVVSNALCNVIPARRIQPSYQGLLNMTSNDLNAWKFLGPAMPPCMSVQSWSQSDISDENSLIGRDLDFGGFAFEGQDFCSQIFNSTQQSYHTSNYDQTYDHNLQSFCQIPLETWMIDSGYVRESETILAGQSQGWARENTSIASDLKIHNSENMTSCMHRRCAAWKYGTPRILPADIGAGPDSATTTYINNDGVPGSTHADHGMWCNLGLSGMLKPAPCILLGQSWWQDTNAGAERPSPAATDFWASYSKDIGTPEMSKECEECSTKSDWSPETAPFETVSPQALILTETVSVAQNPPKFSTEVPTMGLTAYASGAAIVQQGRSPYCKEESAHLTDRSALPRKKLPSKPTNGNFVPILPGKHHLDDTITEHAGLQAFRTTKNKTTLTGRFRIAKMSPKKQASKRDRRKLRSENMAENRDDQQSCDGDDNRDDGVSDSDEKPATKRSAKDDFLIESKRAGMSYRAIRHEGGFTEAESTLRGRYRTLTKAKKERVRKPEWQDKDIRLLKKAVQKLAKGPDPQNMKVPWKLVADYIRENGGSYHFGNATCRKRWDELRRESRIDKEES